MTTIAFVGLGAMGLPMANNLIAAGHTVRGFDINPKAIASLMASGGVACDSTRQACDGADMLILMVVNIEQARQALFDGGALEALPKAAPIFLMATCPPDSVRVLDHAVKQAGKRLVDCPVSGGVSGATSGSLTIMASCDTQTFADVKAVFDLLGKRVFHVGPEPGQGAMCKTVNQLLCGVHIAVAAEAFSLAKKSGLDLSMLLEIMGGSAAASWMLNDRGPRMLQSDPAVRSAVDIFVKDLGIVMQAGKDAKAALPLTAAALQMYLGASGRGEGALDDSQVIRSFDVLNGVK